MATKNIGYIAELTGAAQVRTAEGIINVLSVGDKVSDRDVLITGQGSNVIIAFYSGQKLQVGENAEVLLDETVYAENSSYTDEQVDQITALQEAILEGKDLSELEETAAGNDQGESAGLHQTPIYERDGREGEVDTRPTDFIVDGDTLEQDFTGNDDAIGIIPQSTSQPVAPASLPSFFLSAPASVVSNKIGVNL